MANDYIFDVDVHGALHITNDFINRIKNFRQIRSNDKESGGVILGSHLALDGWLSIVDFTQPQPADKCSRYHFHRSSMHNELVNKIWHASNKTITYLGLWHTHPEPNPIPSKQDHSDWEDAVRNSKFDGNALLFMIIGTSHIGIWLGVKNKSQFIKIGTINLGE
ncbi:Mov34/MPN/PAD-1 family protein [Shewanella salipaludis]|uniref:JAB domain-containing protein n=1 Tax=Shewanella salipaludis TaxID=2723052 RepID=A0A972FYY2_9GAMM|nr:Mov34/MPN/PAD-1 family protein [Shewanella salipaludis]NMH64456.1 hypothetical protein [Shewanella salipaludis]